MAPVWSASPAAGWPRASSRTSPVSPWMWRWPAGAGGGGIGRVPPADDCPDSVFIEDTVVICEDLAVLTRPGAPARRPEVAGVAQAVSELGLGTATIEEAGALEGGG